MNARVVMLLVGLLAGSLVGYLTRPVAAELKVGPVSVEVQGNRPAAAGDGLTTGQMQHIAIFAALGAVIGFGMGYAVGGRA